MISKYIFLTWTTSLNYIFFNSLIHIYTSIFDISKSTTEPPSSLFLQSPPFQLNCSILPVAWAKTNKKKNNLESSFLSNIPHPICEPMWLALTSKYTQNSITFTYFYYYHLNQADIISHLDYCSNYFKLTAEMTFLKLKSGLVIPLLHALQWLPSLLIVKAQTLNL